MSDPLPDAGAAPGFGKSWIPLSLLILIVAFGALLRLDHITKQNLWLDEYWTLYLATGRGNEVFQTPKNQIIEHPPDVGFTAAPAWWHIWNGVSSTSHPPLYHIILRLWVDLVGDRDGPIRLLSALFSLGSVVLIYVAVREFSGDRRQAVIASALMALAPIQIYYSQQVRPYTMIQFTALIGAIILITIEKRGWSWSRLTALSLVVLALSLTHYFSAGLIAAFAIYSLIRFRGIVRLAAFSAIVLAALVAAALWGPHLHDYSLAGYGRIPNRNLLHLVLSVPQRLTMETNHDPLAMADNGSWFLVVSIAAMAYLFPLLMLRGRRYLLFWWLWVAGAVGLVFVFDVARHSTLLSITRYVIAAAPGVYALLAVPLPGRVGKLAPWIILAGVLVFSVDYTLLGPPNSQDVKIISNLVKQEAAPSDVVIVTGNYYFAGDKGPPMTYFAIAHYAGPWNVPIVFGASEISKQVQLQLRHYRRVWVVGISPESDTRKILPGWQIHDIHGPGDSNLLWYVTPGDS